MIAAAGRTIRTFISWRLQRGERIATLGLLRASTTVTGAVFTQVAIRRISLMGIALTVVWLFSPTGGQASLRVLSLGNQTMTSSFNHALPAMSMTRWTSGTFARRREPLVDYMSGVGCLLTDIGLNTTVPRRPDDTNIQFRKS
jgi:hypothetical protein